MFQLTQLGELNEVLINNKIYNQINIIDARSDSVLFLFIVLRSQKYYLWLSTFVISQSSKTCGIVFRLEWMNESSFRFFVLLPVRFVHEHVVAADLLLHPVLQLAVGGTGVLVSSLVQGVAEFAWPLEKLNYNILMQNIASVSNF